MERVEQIVRELFQIIGIEKIEIKIKKDNSLKDKELLIVNVNMGPKEAKYFLKENTEGLNAIQRLLRVLISKKDSKRPFLVLDINDYRKEREKELTESAIKAAKQARRTKKPVLLDPMPAYERRLVHLKLAEQPDIVTESTGEEPERRVVVRLYP